MSGGPNGQGGASWRARVRSGACPCRGRARAAHGVHVLARARRARAGAGVLCWLAREQRGEEGKGGQGTGERGVATSDARRDTATCARPWLSPACIRRLRPPFCLPRRAVRSQRRGECRAGLNSTIKPHISRIDPRVARIGEEQVGDHRVFDDLLEPKQRAIYYLIFQFLFILLGTNLRYRLSILLVSVTTSI